MGCSSSNGGSGTHGTFDDAGGTLTLPDGTTVQIPAGALSAPVDVVATRISDLTAAGYGALPAGFDAGTGTLLVLEPHGTTFATPVTVRLPYSGPASELVVLRLANAADQTWEPVLGVTYEDGDDVAVFQTSSFSVYAAAQVAMGGCPCFNGADLLVFESTLPAGERLMVDTSAPPTSSDYSSQASRRDPRDSTNGYLVGFYDVAAGTGYCSVMIYNQTTSPATQYAARFPNAPAPTTTGNQSYHRSPALDRGQALSCASLLTRHSAGPVVSIGLAAEGVPSGEALVVSVDGGTEIPITVNGQLTFGYSAVNVGMPYAVTITRQPTGATCQVAASSPAQLTGTLAANSVIEFDCSPVPTLPQVFTDFCNSIDVLACTDVTVASCLADITSERDATDVGCHDEFDAVFECAAPLVGDMTTPSAGCNSTSGWDLAFPSPCQAALDALEACTAGPEIACNSIDDDMDGLIDEDDVTGAIIDTDGDGVPDACESNPNDACPAFTVTQLRDLLALPGATCHLPTAPIPAEFQGVGLTEFAGAVLFYGDADGSREDAWVALDNVGTYGWSFGCGDVDGTPTTQCTNDVRPARDGAEITMTQYEACLDVVNYACQ